MLSAIVRQVHDRFCVAPWRQSHPVATDPLPRPRLPALAFFWVSGSFFRSCAKHSKQRAPEEGGGAPRLFSYRPACFSVGSLQAVQDQAESSKWEWVPCARGPFAPERGQSTSFPSNSEIWSLVAATSMFRIC